MIVAVYAVAGALALIAFGVWVRLYRSRQSASLTSLILPGVFVLTVFGAALPPTINLTAPWCSSELVSAGAVDSDNLAADLARSIRALARRPCLARHLEVQVTQGSDAVSIPPDETNELIAAAVAANASVSFIVDDDDVAVSTTVALRDREDRRIGADVGIPERFTREAYDNILVSLESTSRRSPAAGIRCRLNGGPAVDLAKSTLGELVATRLSAGLHLLQCQQGRGADAMWANRYLSVTSPEHVLVISGTGSSADERRYDFNINYPTSVTRGFDLEATVVAEGDTTRATVETSTFIVLDRVQSADTISGVLARMRPGTPVVIAGTRAGAMRKLGFTASKLGDWWDRRPRLTFVLDKAWDETGTAKRASIPCAPGADRSKCQELARMVDVDASMGPGDLEVQENVLKQTVNAWGRQVVGSAWSDVDVPTIRAGLPEVTLLSRPPRDSDWDRIHESTPSQMAQFAESESEKRAAPGPKVLYENALVVLASHLIMRPECGWPASTPPDRAPMAAPDGFAGWTTWFTVADTYACALSAVYGAELRREEQGSNLGRVVRPTGPIASEPPFLMTRTALEQSVLEYRVRGDQILEDALKPDSNLQAKVQRADDSDSSMFSLPAEEPGLMVDAPLSFAALEFPGVDPQRIQPTVYAWTAADDFGRAARPLSIGTFHRGSPVLTLAASPFVDPSVGKDGGDPLVQLRHAYLTDARDRDWLGAKPDPEHPLLGISLVQSFYAHNRATVANHKGEPVLDRAILRDNGELRLVLASPGGIESSDLTLADKRRPGGPTLTARLVGGDAARGTVEYAIGATELERALGTTECREFGLTSGTDKRGIMICAPALTRRSARAERAAALTRIAEFTGGCFTSLADADACRATVARPPSTARLSIRLGLLALFAMFARRALRKRRTSAPPSGSARSQDPGHRRFEPPDALVASRGDWDGAATTWQRFGSFGGRRPLQPGDRVAAMTLDDLLLIHAGYQLIPRVDERRQPSSPPLAILVNLGATIFSGPRGADKAEALALMAELLAAQTWAQGGRVSVFRVDGDRVTELLADVGMSPGPGAVAALFTQAGRPTLDPPAPWSPGPELPGAVAYLSDMQLEDMDRLAAWVSGLEAQGTRVAGVMVQTDVERTMIEGGFLAGSWLWVDRAEWTTADVRKLQADRVSRADRVFDGTTGGLAWVRAGISAQDALLTLDGSRILRIFD